MAFTSFSISGSGISIDSSSGVLTFDSEPDYETQSSYSRDVTVTDGYYSTQQSITININDVNELSPVITSSGTYIVDENQNLIGFVTATDDDSDTLFYEVIDGATEISISDQGLLTFNACCIPDYEQNNSYGDDDDDINLAIEVSDGTYAVQQQLIILINDIEEPTN